MTNPPNSSHNPVMQKKLKGEFMIWKEIFVIMQSRKTISDAFANIIDHNGITVITNQTKYSKDDVIEIEKNWRLITFLMDLPFTLVGFIAKISTSLAVHNIPIFVISSFSTDHILIKDKYIKKAIEILQRIGFELMNSVEDYK